ncbi:hypothetical protein ACTOB_000737 [Actinoplanes oblitus]|uniref:Uncharacterized protein n=1 Tax=Actinoplanes oblitus TaxID=3040509 RepID=A0ABY8WII6_9ACTN|nr:hypothetical protein [Actinoplanes oblitus]WIM97232.1 hypothetical protein ACTOB_000737 [Actinoplanes oblitus]
MSRFAGLFTAALAFYAATREHFQRAASASACWSARRSAWVR